MCANVQSLRPALALIAVIPLTSDEAAGTRTRLSTGGQSAPSRVDPVKGFLYPVREPQLMCVCERQSEPEDKCSSV